MKGNRNMRQTGRLIGIVMIVMILVPLDADGQVVLPPEEEPRRRAVYQIGAGTATPIASFGAAVKPFVFGPNETVASFGDGYARSGTFLNFRVCVPLSRRFDIVADLIIDHFKMRTDAFREQSNLYIRQATYHGKTLSLGTRWYPLQWSWGRGYLMGTAGMYQLINSKALLGRHWIERGAFKAGASIGAGLIWSRFVVPVDLSLLFHRYTDFGHFVQGDIAWVAFAVTFSFPMEEER